MWIVNNAIPQALLVDFPPLVSVAIKTQPSILACLARLVSLVTLVMHGHLLNSISPTLSHVLKKAVMVLTMAEHPAENATPLLYFSRVVPLATKETTLRMKAGEMTTIK